MNPAPPDPDFEELTYPKYIPFLCYFDISIPWNTVNKIPYKRVVKYSSDTTCLYWNLLKSTKPTYHLKYCRTILTNALDCRRLHPSVDTRQKKHVLIGYQTWHVLQSNIWGLTAVKANFRAKGKFLFLFLFLFLISAFRSCFIFLNF